MSHQEVSWIDRKRGIQEVDHWQIRAITALTADWTNVFYLQYEHNRGLDPWLFERCPALLLIEHAKTVRHVTAEGHHRQYDVEDAGGIGDTQASFATIGEFGDLNPLVLSDTRWYLGTIPGGEPDEAARKELLDRAIADGVITEPAKAGEPEEEIA